MNKLTAADSGCWVDGHWGHYIAARTIQIAIGAGWNDLDANHAAEKYLAGDIDDGLAELVYDLGDEAVDWMNANIVPEGYAFGWWEGELYLQSDTDWEDGWGLI